MIIELENEIHMSRSWKGEPRDLCEPKVSSKAPRLPKCAPPKGAEVAAGSAWLRPFNVLIRCVEIHGQLKYVISSKA